jgi:hypothetical protein
MGIRLLPPLPYSIIPVFSILVRQRLAFGFAGED